MIRTAYPISRLKQVHLRLELVTRRTRRVQARREGLANAAAVPAAKPTALSAPSGRTAGEKAVMEAFYNRYDDLTGLICLAAQEGVTSAREARYQRERAWFLRTYPDVCEFLGAFLPAEAKHNACDPFACFWTPPSLSDLLQSDDGTFIARMETAQTALAAWEAALS